MFNQNTEIKLYNKLANAYTSFAFSRRKCFLGTLFVTALLFILLNASWRQTFANDDWAISVLLSGLLQNGQGISLFLNPILSQTILAFNTLFGSCNWFFVIELSVAFVCYFLLSYLAFRTAHPLIACAFFFFYTLVVLPQCSLLSNFTVVAASCCTTGAVLITLHLKRRHVSKSQLLFAIVIYILGSLWRWDIFLLSLPFFVFTFVASVVVQKRKNLVGKVLIACLLSTFVIIVSCIGFRMYSISFFADEPQCSWQKTQILRSKLTDYPVHRYDEIAEELSVLGVSKNDYKLITDWMSEDPDFFTVDRLEAITKIAHVDKGLFQAFQYGLGDFFNKYVLNIFSAGCFCIFLLALLLSQKSIKHVYSLIIIAMCLMLVLYFASQGRLPSRVHDSVWLLGYASIMVLGTKESLPEEMKDRIAVSRFRRLLRGGFLLLPCFAVVVVLTFGFLHFTPARIGAVLNARDFNPSCSLLEYMDDHEENCFVFTVQSNIDIKTACMLRAFPPEAYLKRGVVLGGWNTQSPSDIERNKQLGMENPLKNLAENKQALLVFQPDRKPDEILTFIQEHYYPEAYYELVDVIQDSDKYGTLDVYRFYSE